MYKGIAVWIVVVGFNMYGCHPAKSPVNKSGTSETKDTFKQLVQSDKFSLPAVLDEISGITFAPAGSDTIYAIQDEDGKLFAYDLISKKITASHKFGKRGDYEDIATDGKFFYVLKSNGDIYSFPFDYKSSNSEATITSGILPKGEYESMAIDLDEQSLYVLCKICPIDKAKPQVTGYKFSIAEQGHLVFKETFFINMNGINDLNQSHIERIKPSAMALNQRTKDWYLISSIDKLLIVTDQHFVAKKVYPFNRKSLEQPEGLAFDKANNLYISSEIGSAKAAYIYQYQNIDK